MNRKTAGAFTAFALLISIAAHAAGDPATTCEALKNRAAGKYLTCLQKAYAFGATSPNTAKYQYLLGRCATKLADFWSRAETKAANAGMACADAYPATDRIQEFLVCASGCIHAGINNQSCFCAFGNCPSGGKRVHYTCWYYGSSGQNCDSVCASHGLSYNPQTWVHAGSYGTFDQCDSVLDELGAPATTYGDSFCTDAIGCAYQNSGAGRIRCTEPETTSAASEISSQRACACD